MINEVDGQSRLFLRWETHHQEHYIIWLSKSLYNVGDSLSPETWLEVLGTCRLGGQVSCSRSIVLALYTVGAPPQTHSHVWAAWVQGYSLLVLSTAKIMIVAWVTRNAWVVAMLVSKVVYSNGCGDELWMPYQPLVMGGGPHGTRHVVMFHSTLIERLMCEI